MASLLAAQRIEEALPLFEQMLKDYPDTHYLHYAYGSALASLGRKEQAEAQFREEARVSPKSALPHMRLAALAIEAHRMKEARASAESAVKLAPQWAPAHEMLAKVLQASGSTSPGHDGTSHSEAAFIRPAADEELAAAYARGGQDQAEAHTEASLPPAGEDLAAKAPPNAMLETSRLPSAIIRQKRNAVPIGKKAGSRWGPCSTQPGGIQKQWLHSKSWYSSIPSGVPPGRCWAFQSLRPRTTRTH